MEIILAKVLAVNVDKVLYYILMAEYHQIQVTTIINILAIVHIIIKQLMLIVQLKVRIILILYS